MGGDCSSQCVGAGWSGACAHSPCRSPSHPSLCVSWWGGGLGAAEWDLGSGSGEGTAVGGKGMAWGVGGRRVLGHNGSKAPLLSGT